MLKSSAHLPTLRQYIDQYQELRKTKSHADLRSEPRVLHMPKHTNQLELQINQKLKSIKNGLSIKSNQSNRIAAMENLHELAKLIQSIFEKLKNFEGETENSKQHHKNKETVSTPSFKKSTRCSKKTSIEAIPVLQNPCIKNNLISPPQQMSKRFQLSNDLSLSGSVTTQDLSPKFTNISVKPFQNSQSTSGSIKVKKVQIPKLDLEVGKKYLEGSEMSEVITQEQQQYHIRISQKSK